MKAIRLFSMAAVALMMGACSSENDIELAQQLAPETGKIHFEATIAAPNADARTRTTYSALSDGTISVKWKVGDQIALIHGGHKDVVSVNSVDEGTGVATITGSITAPASTEEDVQLVYPAASVDATGTGTGTKKNDTYISLGLAQDGTLSFISNYLDAREGSGKIISDGASGGTLKENVKLVSGICIWKLTLKNNASTPAAINAKNVTLKLGTTPIATPIAFAANPTGSSEYYLCVVPKLLTDGYTAAPTATFTIEVSDGTNKYTYTKTSQLSLVANKFYQSEVNMANAGTASAYRLAAAATSSDLGKLICTNGHIHASVATDDGCSATRVAMITYVGSDAETSTTYNHGLALALADASTDAKWCDQTTSVLCLGSTDKQKGDETAAKGDVAGIANTNTLAGSTSHDHSAAKAARDYTVAAPAGTSGWFLPSAGQWNKMFYANGGDASKYDGSYGLNTKLETAGGTTAKLLANYGYWSSTECSGTQAWRWCNDDREPADSYVVLWDDQIKHNTLTYRVRACLAF